jgi:hypothetical protein
MTTRPITDSKTPGTIPTPLPHHSHFHFAKSSDSNPPRLVTIFAQYESCQLQEKERRGPAFPFPFPVPLLFPFPPCYPHSTTAALYRKSQSTQAVAGAEARNAKAQGQHDRLEAVQRQQRKLAGIGRVSGKERRGEACA